MRIVNTISISLLWMIANATAGIKYNFAFWDTTFTKGNFIFYIFFVASLAALIWYLLKLWGKPLNIPK